MQIRQYISKYFLICIQFFFFFKKNLMDLTSKLTQSADFSVVYVPSIILWTFFMFIVTDENLFQKLRIFQSFVAVSSSSSEYFSMNHYIT